MFTNIDIDHYKVLGIDRNATEDEIKKAFRKLALQYHPDKYKEDDDMFKKINTAYQILGDPDKRRLYDLSQNLGNDTFNIDYKTVLLKALFNLLQVAVQVNEKNSSQNHDNNAAKVVKTSKENQKDSKDKQDDKRKLNIKLNLQVTLDDLYKKEIKKINVKVKRNNGLITIPIYLSLLNYEELYIYKGVGDEEDGKYGDIIIKIDIKQHDYVRIDKYLFRYDLYIDEQITLYELYYGVKKIIKYLCDETIIIDRFFDINNNTNNFSFVHVEIGKGLPYFDEENEEEKRGDLYICFRLKLPLIKDQDNIKTFLQMYFNEEPNRIC